MVALVDDELTAEDVTCPADVERLNILELYRLGFVPDLPADVQAAKATAWGAPTPLGCLPSAPIPPQRDPHERDRDRSALSQGICHRDDFSGPVSWIIEYP